MTDGLPSTPLESLNRQQVGRVGEYMARVEFAKAGFQIFTPDVDDRGVDLLVYRTEVGYIRIQVKTIRKPQIVYMRKAYFELRDDFALVLVLFLGEQPEFFYFPSILWRKPDGIFVDHNYEGGKSDPEYGISITKRNIPLIQKYKFDSSVLEGIRSQSPLNGVG